jgi:hypothetical protein
MMLTEEDLKVIEETLAAGAEDIRRDPMWAGSSHVSVMDNAYKWLTALTAEVRSLQGKLARERSMNAAKDATQRKLRTVAEHLFAHDWEEAELSPSGKRGWFCGLCGKYSQAPVLACLDPCETRIKELEISLGKERAMADKELKCDNEVEEADVKERDRAIDRLTRRLSGACTTCQLREGCTATDGPERLKQYEADKCRERLREWAMGGRLMCVNLATESLYLLVLYLSDGVDTCMNCVVDRWGSEFEFHPNISYEDAFDLVRDKLVQSSAWEYHLFEDNEEVFELNDDGDRPWEGLSDAVEEERDRLRELEKEQEILRRKKQAEIKAEQERLEYVWLKQKFGGRQ